MLCTFSFTIWPSNSMLCIHKVTLTISQIMARTRLAYTGLRTWMMALWQLQVRRMLRGPVRK